MTEHNTAELKRQFDDALSRMVEQKRRMEKARAAWHQSIVRDETLKLASRGIKAGDKVMYSYMGRGDPVIVGLGPAKEVFLGRVHWQLYKIKKDGTVGLAPAGSAMSHELSAIKQEADQ